MKKPIGFRSYQNDEEPDKRTTYVYELKEEN